MKRIMIISASNTGHGHKSIAESFMEYFRRNEQIEARVYEGFKFMTPLDNKFADLYGPVVRNAKEIWRLGFVFSRQLPGVLEAYIIDAIENKFLAAFNDFKPDIIVSVHSFFSGTICAILKKHNLDVPVFTMIADMIDLHPLWLDTRVTKTFCPTWESITIAKSYGLTDDQIIMTGFPTRPAFTEAAKTYVRPEYNPKMAVECLIMGGGDGSGNLLQYAKTMLHYFNCNVTIICGRNEVMHKRLTQALAPYGSRAHVLGFVTNVQDYMLKSDLLICRGSPNTMMEAVCCAVPMLITGALPGQEQHNPALMEHYNLGIVCKNLNNFLPCARRLLQNDAEKLQEIRRSQEEYRDLDVAKKIATYIMDYAINGSAEFPEPKKPPQAEMRFSVVNGRIEPHDEKFLTQLPPLVVLKNGKAQLFYIKDNKAMTHKQYVESEKAERLEKRLDNIKKNHAKRQTIKTERLKIRHFVYGDWTALKKIMTDREADAMDNYSFSLSFGNDEIKRLARFFAQNTDYYAVCRKSDNRVIGYVSLVPDDDDNTHSLEFYIIKDYRERGYGTELIKAMADYAMDAENTDMIITKVTDNNLPTKNLLEKLGFEGPLSSTSVYHLDDEGKTIELKELTYTLRRNDKGE